MTVPQKKKKNEKLSFALHNFNYPKDQNAKVPISIINYRKPRSQKRNQIKSTKRDEKKKKMKTKLGILNAHQFKESLNQ